MGTLLGKEALYQLLIINIFVPMRTTEMPETKHQGRAVKHLREILQVKQDTIAMALNISQQSASLLETKETLEPEILDKIAKKLGVPVGVVKNFNEEAAVYNIQLRVY